MTDNLWKTTENNHQTRFCHWFNHPHDHLFRSEDQSWLTAKYAILPPAIFEKWQNPNELIGLRFGVNTRYGLLDIDNGSKWHNEDGLRAIKGVLESIGINDTILIRSSFSDGWHLYYFLPEAVNSFKLAQTVAIALFENGLELKSGQLEIFPNVKKYVENGFGLFNGHRLPLQTGSHLLDDDFDPYTNSLDTFLNHADQVALSVDFDVLSELLTTAGDRYKNLFQTPNVVSFTGFKNKKHSNKAKIWKESLENAIDTGWTDDAQTNDLLGLIAIYGRVFKGIEDEYELAQFIQETAITAPGYSHHCDHQKDIELRAAQWARCCIKKYFPYGSKGASRASKGGPNNEERKIEAMARISENFEDLLQSNRIPEKISELRSLLAKLAHCSERTLAKPDYLPLWHPKHRNPVTASDTEFRSHGDIKCVFVSFEAEKNLLNLPTECSEKIIQESLFQLFGSPRPPEEVVKSSESLAGHSFKSRQDSENINDNISFVLSDCDRQNGEDDYRELKTNSS
jgi:hypothetical protein